MAAPGDPPANGRIVETCARRHERGSGSARNGRRRRRCAAAASMLLGDDPLFKAERLCWQLARGVRSGASETVDRLRPSARTTVLPDDAAVSARGGSDAN